VRTPTPATAARAARGDVEDALAAQGWPWSPRLSWWLDVLIVIEEVGA
jgi:hypothetical protein